MEETIDGGLRVISAGPASRFANNIYIVIDSATNEAAFIDAPGEPELSIAAAKEAGVRPSQILLTHSHGDHTASIEALQAEFGCKLVANREEVRLQEGQPDVSVGHDDEVMVGSLPFRALWVPGHTPGSTTYVYGLHAFVGDTLFPGGPGRTASNENLQQELESIRTHLYVLDGDTRIYPGHGPGTTIGASKLEYAPFAAREHPDDLKGDVLWSM